MKDKFLPERCRKQLIHRKGDWICYVRNMFDDIIATVTGRTQKEVREKGAEEVKQYMEAIRAQYSKPKSSGWQRSMGNQMRPKTAFLAVMQFLRSMFDEPMVPCNASSR